MSISREEIERGVTSLTMSGMIGRVAGYDVRAYFLRGVLIDTGFPHAGNEPLGAVRELRPRGAIVTHWHEDHAGNAALLASHNVPLRMHALCEQTLRARPRIGHYRRVVWGRPDRLAHALVPFDIAPLRTIETPGHTRDHLVVWDEERGIVASGDLFLGVRVRIAHFEEEPRALVRSLRTVLALRPRLLLDAHRGVLREPMAVLQAKIDWLDDTIGDIEELAAHGLTEGEIQRTVLGREEFTGYASFREYSRRAFVRAVLRERS